MKLPPAVVPLTTAAATSNVAAAGFPDASAAVEVGEAAAVASALEELSATAAPMTTSLPNPPSVGTPSLGFLGGGGGGSSGSGSGAASAEKMNGGVGSVVSGTTRSLPRLRVQCLLRRLCPCRLPGVRRMGSWVGPPPQLLVPLHQL